MDDGTEKLMKKLKKFKDGQPNEDDEISDDSDDSDYAENAGEYSLYDSPLEEVDELVTIKQILEQIHQADQSAYEFLVSNLSQEDKDKFIEVVGQADQLKQREQVCRKAFDDNETAKKVQSVSS